MFKNAVLRLTLWYLLILMSLSVMFSLILFRVSTSELDANSQRLQSLINNQDTAQLFPGFSEFNQARLNQAEESRRHIKLNLLYFNLVILGIGGAISYFLAEATLQPIQDSLELMQRFTADASHELRTPLTAMKSEIEVALRDRNLSLAESKQLHRSTLEEVNRLEGLASGLLRLSHNDQETNLDFGPIHLAELIEQVSKRFQPLLAQHQIKLKTTMGPKEAWGEQDSLEELLSILLENAIKYSPDGSLITITTKPVLHKPQVLIHVQDQGIGIKKADLPHIFERFYRADKSRSNGQQAGHGLGLSIAKRIASRHHGSISVKSIPNKGSRFTVTLPTHAPRHLPFLPSS